MAKKRAGKMLEMATKEKDTRKAQRYFEITKKIGKRNKVRLGKGKQAFCKYCGAAPSSLKIRLKAGVRIIECGECGKTRKIPFKPR